MNATATRIANRYNARQIARMIELTLNLYGGDLYGRENVGILMRAYQNTRSLGI